MEAVLNGSEALEDLAKVIRRCQKCHLSRTRKNAVPGEGPGSAEIMFIGEAPGRREDELGRPFVGRAGKFLEELLGTIGLRREGVFIGNVLKCRPVSSSGEDRKPAPNEVSACSPYIDRQIELIGPEVICTLGDTATTYILSKYGFSPGKISQLHGVVLSVASLRIVPTYHPAAALYAYELRTTLLRDFRRIGDLLRQTTLERF